MLAKGAKERIGTGTQDFEEVLAHPYLMAAGFDRKQLLEKKAQVQSLQPVEDAVPSESLSEAGPEEPITMLFPGLSRSDLQKKLELEASAS